MRTDLQIKTRPCQSLLDAPDMLPLLQRIYAARNVQSLDELESGLDKLLSYRLLTDIEKAIELIVLAMQSGSRILIVGDFDADGATSCAVAVKALKAMGHYNVSYLVPNRFEYGYGLTPEIVDVALKQSPDLIVTVDNGIASIEGVKRAHEHGISVLVSDHHLPGEQLPEAEAIVNPNQPGDQFPSKNLAGVGVIFYIMIAVRQALREMGWFEEQNIPEPNLASLLDLVALGTVADVVPLDQNNRILVSQGLARIRAGLVCPGIKALLETANKHTHKITAADMGYVVGPRLNAAGRLDDMTRGIECLLAEDTKQAKLAAMQLNELNYQRRNIESEMKEQAITELDDVIKASEQEQIPYAISLFRPDWHQGVIGILASRIKEAWHRPVIVFAQAGDHELKGSARSIKGLHIRDALDVVANRNPGLILKFGGHAMAAGLSISKDDFETFRQQFNMVVGELVSPEDLDEVIYTDGSLEPMHMTLDVADLLQSAGPWGQSFPEPVFVGDFHVLERKIVGENHLKMKVAPLSDETDLHQPETILDAIAFGQADNPLSVDFSELKLVYRLDINDYFGTRNVQLVVEHIASIDTDQRVQ